ncbi:MAG: amidohydrolase family protein [Beijerinckiaceae bacterium]
MFVRMGAKYQHLISDSACACCAPEVHEAVRRINLQLSRRGMLAGLAAAAAAGHLPAAAQTRTTSTLFTNCAVFPGSSLGLRRGMNVLVEGNRITAVQAGRIKAPAGATVIDAGGRTLMPGLIDNHCHITMSASSMADLVNEATPVETIMRRGQDEAKAILMRGFTAVRDMGGPVFPIKIAIDAGREIGPRVWPSGATVSQTSGHGDARLPSEPSYRFTGQVTRSVKLGASFIADGRDEVLTATRENLRFGASQIKVMAGGGAATLYDPLDVAQYTLDELKAAVDAAADWNTYVTVHAYTVRSVRRAVEAGVKCIEHGQLLDEATIRMLGQRGIWLSLQVLDPAPPTAPEAVRLKKQQVVDGTDKAYIWAKKHKVKLAWGTDFLFDPRQNVKQASEILKLRRWFSAGEILKMVTYDNAQLLALSGPRTPYAGKLGVIESGALADLLLVDGDPIANLDLIGDPEKNFKVIMKDGRIHKNTM